MKKLIPNLPARRALALLALAALGSRAAALEVVPSGFGTIGYARSDRPYAFERFIDDHGSFERDSVLGLQLDARLAAQWSATLQLKAAPSLRSDSRWDLRPAWAFLAWRPSDDWLLRAGRLRAPLYMYSESLDVGVTHAMARLPTEMYSIAPSTDFEGLSIGKTWQRDANEFSVDAYHGRIDTTARVWLRDGVPGALEPGARFFDIDVRTTGIVFTLRQPSGQWRASWHRTSTRQASGAYVPVRYPFVPIAPGLGYYQVDPSLPGPGFSSVPRIENDIFTVGVEQQLPGGLRVAAEYARNVQHDTELGSDTRGGYVALFRPVGDLTPYVSFGMLRSNGQQLDWYERLSGNVLPAFVPGAASLNAAQRVAAETFYATDQRSLAFGAAWMIGAQQSFKAEWKRTRIGRVSRLVDTPPGSGEVRDTNIDILSVSYSFAF